MRDQRDSEKECSPKAAGRGEVIEERVNAPLREPTSPLFRRMLAWTKIAIPNALRAMEISRFYGDQSAYLPREIVAFLQHSK